MLSNEEMLRRLVVTFIRLLVWKTDFTQYVVETNIQIAMYSRRQYKVSVTYRLLTVLYF